VFLYPEFFVADDKLLLTRVLQVRVDLPLLSRLLLQQPVHAVLQLEFVVQLELRLLLEVHGGRSPLEIIVFGEAVGPIRVLQPVLESLEQVHGVLIMEDFLDPSGK
jgi:hypothetical protein